MKKLLAALLMVLVLLGCTSALAQEATDITREVTITSGGKKTKPKAMRDRDYNTSYTVR